MQIAENENSKMHDLRMWMVDVVLGLLVSYSHDQGWKKPRVFRKRVFLMFLCFYVFKGIQRFLKVFKGIFAFSVQIWTDTKFRPRKTILYANL